MNVVFKFCPSTFKEEKSMKNRLISLLLCVVLLLSVLTGCQETKDEEDIANEAKKASRSTVTLTLWLVTEKETTPEAVSLVEEALNKILKAKYKTRVELSVFTEDEYYDALDARLAAIDEYVASDDYVDPEDEEDTETTAAETIRNEWGIEEDAYPEVKGDQLDIIFLSGSDNYFKYSDELGILERLDDALKANSKKLKSYIDPAFFSALSALGGTYAIPNRHILGEYTYLLTNRELVDKYFYDPDDLTTLEKCAEFIEEMANKEPEYTTIKEISYPLYTTYWSIDGERSLLGSVGNASTAESTYLSMRNVLTYARYTDQLKTVMQYKEKGYIAEDPDAVDKFAVAVVRGGSELQKVYGDEYYMNVLEAPTATEDDLFKGMFAVTYHTKSLDRSMEVLTLLNTDPTFRNILQYGIEGVHYELDEEDGSLKRLNHDYMMKLVNTGNTFIAYPEEGQPLDIWEYGKTQNLAVAVSPFNGFTFYDTNLDMDLMERLAELSKGYFERLDACTTLEELNAFLEEAGTELAGNEDIKKATSTSEEGSPNAIYTDWYYIKYPPINED